MKGWQMFTRTTSKSFDRLVCFALYLHSLIIVILVLRISFTLPIFKSAEEDNLSNMSLCVFIHIFEPLVESGEAHVRTELLEKDLYKNPAGWCCGLLTHPDALQHLVKKCSSRQEKQGLDNWDTLCIKLKFNQIGKIPFLHSRAQSLCTVGEQTVVPHSWVCWSPVCELYRTALKIWPQNSPYTPSSADRTSKYTKRDHEESFLHVIQTSIHTPYTNINMQTSSGLTK